MFGRKSPSEEFGIRSGDDVQEKDGERRTGKVIQFTDDGYTVDVRQPGGKGFFSRFIGNLKKI